MKLWWKQVTFYFLQQNLMVEKKIGFLNYKTYFPKQNVRMIFKQSKYTVKEFEP